MQFRNCLKEYMLHSIFSFLSIFQVFHRYAVEQQGIPFQQWSKPFILVIGIKLPQNFLVCEAGMLGRIHSSLSAFMIDAESVGMHKRDYLFPNSVL